MEVGYLRPEVLRRPGRLPPPPCLCHVPGPAVPRGRRQRRRGRRSGDAGARYGRLGAGQGASLPELHFIPFGIGPLSCVNGKFRLVWGHPLRRCELWSWGNPKICLRGSLGSYRMECCKVVALCPKQWWAHPKTVGISAMV